MVDLKGSNKVGQFDMMQFGSDRHPTKIIQLYVPSAAYVRLLLTNMKDGIQPIVSFLVWINYLKEVEIEVLELLSITGGEDSGNGSNADSPTLPDSNSNTGDSSDSPADSGGLLVN
ncbi:hypothetical protein GC101_21995 [Paenibacillus sp. LMG 31459]|uniref:Uncharacterized protein n=1 Tax=Paenibacillus phytohabitans TaxID=2654978 RepID=A0ABX1YKH0_9BACL|nr:hypothetical protein [Paenibacillus phytohabitans]NOU81538.1 hypothetical protein [Paenibacillus phytohabitans]